MTYRLAWLADVARAAGLKVEEVPGWQTRGHGDMAEPLWGVICHHTAGGKAGNMPSLETVTEGRPELAGPLCNYALGRDGTVYTVAAGCAWHAGQGAYHGMTAGNSHWIGIEAENSGYIDPDSPLYDLPWPQVQIDAYARLCAAILDHLHLGPDRCIAHHEWAPKRKTDPSFGYVPFNRRPAKPYRYDFAPFRALVASHMVLPKAAEHDAHDCCGNNAHDHPMGTAGA